jgi:hypothetical protein
MFFHNNILIGQGGNGFKALQQTTNIDLQNIDKYTTKNVNSKMVCLFIQDHSKEQKKHNSQEISC